MNEPLSPDRGTVLAKAARLAGAGGLTVLDRDCQARGYRLDLVAVTGTGTLVVIEVTAAEAGDVSTAAAEIPGPRMLELVRGGTAWLCDHDGDFTGFRVDSMVLTPDEPGQGSPRAPGSAL